MSCMASGWNPCLPPFLYCFPCAEDVLSLANPNTDHAATATDARNPPTSIHSAMEALGTDIFSYLSFILCTV